MQQFKFLVLMEHPVTGVPTPISSLMAQTKKQAERRAKALYTEAAWVQSEASHSIDQGTTERLLARFRESDRKWRKHRFADEADD